MKVVKRYKLTVIRWISSRELTYSMATIVNNTVLSILKALREYILKVSSQEKNFVTMERDGC